MLKDYEEYRPYINFITKYRAASNASTGSKFDSNANVENKNVTTLTGELNKEPLIGINRLQMKDAITELYGEDLAKSYLFQLENHQLYKHDETQPELNYCVSITMYPFLFEGVEKIGGISGPPKNLQSFCGSFINLVFAIAAQFAGAVSTPEFLTYMDYFIRGEYGNDYYKKPNKIVDLSNKHRSIDDVICQYFQQVVYSLNQPAAARNYQSVFWNIAYFDEPYFNGIFEDFVFPDGSAPEFESTMWLQKRFMKWFNQERLRKILTFPVETANLLYYDHGDDYDFVDEDFSDFVAEMWAEGHSFFLYISDSVDSLASCCFTKDTRVVWKFSNSGEVYISTFEDLYYAYLGADKEDIQVLNNGSWVDAKPIKLPNRQIYKVTTSNNKTYYMTDNHINVTLNGEKPTEQLTTDDYLAFNINSLEPVSDKDEGLTYEQGFAVGAFLHYGSFDSANADRIIYEYNLSQFPNEERILMTNLDKLVQKMNLSNKPVYNDNYIYIDSKELISFIRKWIIRLYDNDKIIGTINCKCLFQSINFRHGILDGWYNKNGGNYTPSLRLVRDIEVLITSLGFNSAIYKGVSSYHVRWHDLSLETNIWKDDVRYFKIISVEKYDYNDDVYCIECKDTNNPYFTLPSGLITHNCRLRNELQDNTFSYTLGAGGVSTGSKCVMTLNFNRFIQDLFKTPEEYYNDKDHVKLDTAIRTQVDKIHKYLISYNKIMEDNFKSGLNPVYDAGYISMDKQFLTIGINGLVEGAEYLGLDISVNDDYFDYCTACLKPIYEENKKAKTPKIMFNTEYVPAENLGVKNAKWDKEDGYFSPRDCYNSYFYKPDDNSISIIDKFILHGEKTTKWLDGGSALHCNLDEHLSKEQYKKLMLNAIKTKTNYFTFNIPNTICNDCKYISKHKFDKCPRCSSENVDWVTRIIGYLKMISKFSEQRQIEAGKRYYANGVTEIE